MIISGIIIFIQINGPLPTLLQKKFFYFSSSLIENTAAKIKFYIN